MSSSEYDIVGAYTCTIFSLYRLGVHITSYVTLGLMLFTFSIWPLYILFMRKPTPAWLLVARWRKVVHVYFHCSFKLYICNPKFCISVFDIDAA